MSILNEFFHRDCPLIEVMKEVYMSIKALEHHLLPLKPYLQEEGVTEICINKPSEVYVEKNQQFKRHRVSELELSFLESLAALIAEFNHKDFPTPLLSGSLPNGERIQCVKYPACEKNTMIYSIRKHHMRNMSLEDYVRAK